MLNGTKGTFISLILSGLLSVRVYSFPCLQAFLDSTEVKDGTLKLLVCLSVSLVSLNCLLLQLFPPNDDKLDKFWVDFNLSSGCVSFFIDDPQVVSRCSTCTLTCYTANLSF